jgi:hypothetical protein
LKHNQNSSGSTRNNALYLLSTSFSHLVLLFPDPHILDAHTPSSAALACIGISRLITEISIIQLLISTMVEQHGNNITYTRQFVLATPAQGTRFLSSCKSSPPPLRKKDTPAHDLRTMHKKQIRELSMPMFDETDESITSRKLLPSKRIHNRISSSIAELSRLGDYHNYSFQSPKKQCFSVDSKCEANKRPISYSCIPMLGSEDNIAPSPVMNKPSDLTRKE